MAKVISANRIINNILHSVENTTVTAHLRNFKKLPKAKDARLVPCTNGGKFTDGSYTTKSWNIEVDVVIDGKTVTHDWNVWLVGAGMKCTTSRFTDLAKAKAMKKEILTKWGKYEEEAKGKASGEIKGMKAREEAIVAALAKKLGVSVDEVKEVLAA